MKMRKLGIGGERDSGGRSSCPNIFELENGDYAIAGTDMTEEMRKHLPPGTKLADYERIVVVPKVIITSAKKDIP